LVSAWIALSESNLENGCVRVVPATHHARLPHKTLRTGDSMLASGLRLESEPHESTVLNVILSGGAISLHHVNLVHGSGPNHSDKPRIGFAVRYVAPEVSQELEHHRVALVRGRDDHHNYSVVSEPPSSKIEESIESLKEIDDWIERVRFAIPQ